MGQALLFRGIRIRTVSMTMPVASFESAVPQMPENLAGTVVSQRSSDGGESAAIGKDVHHLWTVLFGDVRSLFGALLAVAVVISALACAVHLFRLRRKLKARE